MYIMKDLIELEMPNGVKVFAVAIQYVGEYHLVCYAQNRLFTVYVPNDGNMYYDKIIDEYCIIPQYDDILKDYNISE